MERCGGPIVVGGRRRISSPSGLFVGDAAGAVSPMTAGGWDPCLRLADYAAAELDMALTNRHVALRDYDVGALHRRFTGRLMTRHALAQVHHPLTASSGFDVVRTPFGRVASRKVLSGDYAFPDPPEVSLSSAARADRIFLEWPGTPFPAEAVARLNLYFV